MPRSSSLYASIIFSNGKKDDHFISSIKKNVYFFCF